LAPMAHTVPAVHALHLAEIVGAWGVTAQELFARVGLEEAKLVQPGARLTLRELESLVVSARAMTGEAGLGFHVGLKMTIAAHGSLGFAAMTARSIREAAELAVRFAPTRTTALALRLDVEGDAAALHIEERADFGRARDAVLIALFVGIWQIAKTLTGRDLGGIVDVAAPMPPYFPRYAHLVPDHAVRFDRPANALRFPASVLDLPLVTADGAALRVARETCERELERLGPGDTVQQVRELLFDDDRVRRVGEVAKALHVSTRTLKRRLAERDTSFTKLVEEARRDRAVLLLSNPAHSVEEVAARLGYSDAGNFARAFRRWTGQSPTEFRAET